MKQLRYATCLVLVLVLSACGYGTKDQFASETHVEKFQYVHNEPASLTLLTMVSNKNGRGGHSSLVINGSQRVMYDPAGRWYSSHVPERHDLLYGVTPRVLKTYKSFHARDTHHVVSQKIFVSAQVANQAIAAAKLQGRAVDGTCAISTIAILNQLAGFESLPSGYFPEKLMKNFGQLPGVVTTKYYENDVGQN